MNKVWITGNTTAEPEAAVYSGEKKVTFTLAVKGYGDNTDFIACFAWRKTAEIIDKYVHKGDKIGVCGRITTRTYETESGARRKFTEVEAQDVELLGGKREAESKKTEKAAPLVPSDDDEELPF